MSAKRGKDVTGGSFEMRKGASGERGRRKDWEGEEEVSGSLSP